MGCGASSAKKAGVESPHSISANKTPKVKGQAPAKQVGGSPREKVEAKAGSQREKGGTSSTYASSECRLRILFVNDVYELDNWPRFRTAVEKLSDDNTIVLLPGDFLAPSLLSSIDQGRGMVDCMNRCKVQYVCFGNHETDIPHQEMLDRIKESNFTWINSNMPDLGGITLPEYEKITVTGGGQQRKVGLLGLLTEDSTLYRPGAFGGAAILPVLSEADRLQKKLYGEEGVDLVLPMTHQAIALDRAFMQYFSGKGGGDNGNAFPLVIGAHDHEPYEEEWGGSKVLKTGSDAVNVGICDIVWPDPKSNKVDVSVRLEPSANYDPEPSCLEAVQRHQQVLAELDAAPLFLCKGLHPLTSKDNRVQQTSIGTKLVSALRDALGADCCVLNAGNIRGNRDYAPDKAIFTYNDLKAEVPFDVEMVVMPLPGKVIAESVKFTRARSFLSPPQSSGGFMQISDDMTFDDATQTLTHIGGELLDPERVYSAGILFMMMTGMDSIPPLMDWAANNPELMPADACAEMGRPAKLLLVDYFSKAIWYELGTFEELDEGRKGFIAREDILHAAQKHFKANVAAIYVDNVLRAADADSDGRISKEELMRVNLMNASARLDIDANKDGRLDRGELEVFAKKILGDGYDHQIVERILAEMGVGAGETVGARDVERWLHKTFSLEGVKVPGQSLERGEIRAVQTKLLEHGTGGGTGDSKADGKEVSKGSSEGDTN